MRYDLNSVAKQYTGMSKNETALNEAAQNWGIDPKAEMYKLPAMYVGEYAEKDAEITFALWQELKKEINHQDLNSIFDLETSLFSLISETLVTVSCGIENEFFMFFTTFTLKSSASYSNSNKLSLLTISTNCWTISKFSLWVFFLVINLPF